MAVLSAMWSRDLEQARNAGIASQPYGRAQVICVGCTCCVVVVTMARTFDVQLQHCVTYNSDIYNHCAQSGSTCKHHNLVSWADNSITELQSCIADKADSSITVQSFIAGHDVQCGDSSIMSFTQHHAGIT